MAKKRKKKPLKHKNRIQKAEVFFRLSPDLNDKEELVRRYAKRMRISEVTALKDLKELGTDITDQDILEAEKRMHALNVKHGEKLRRKARKRKKHQAKEEPVRLIESDDRFAFIAGYTPGGAAYGISWEEMQEEGKETILEIDPDDLPF